MVQGVKYPNYLNRLYNPDAGKEAFNYLYKLYTSKGIPSNVAILVIKKQFFIGSRQTLLREGIQPQLYTNTFNFNDFWEVIRDSLRYSK